MFIPVFVLPLIAAPLCLALNQRWPTRWLGVGASSTLLLAALALLIVRLQGQLPLVLLDRTWMTLGERAIPLTLAFNMANWPFALLALGGGGLALLVLALAVPLSVRGFGGLFAAALLALATVVFGLANQSALLLPFMWALAALLSFVALRASGTMGGSDAPLLVLVAGLAGALLATGLALLMALAPAGAAPSPAMLIGWTLAALLALGAPPFHASLRALAEAPAALGAALLTAGLPLLGGYALIQFIAGQAEGLPPDWRAALTLLGLLALLACAAGALSATRLRPLAAYLYSAQLGLLLLALGQGAGGARLVAPALLANSALATLACFLAIELLERRAGTDDMAEIVARAHGVVPGLVFLLGAAAAIGLPGTSGWWARRWLLDELLRAAPWAVPILLAGTALLALACLAPLALFWRGQAGQPAAPHEAPAAALASLLGALPLLILGVWPGLAWRGWLADAAVGTALAPLALPDLPAQLICGLAALLLLGLPFLARSRRRVPPPEEQPRQMGVVTPRALGESLAGLAWLALPDLAFDAAWQLLLRLSRLLRRGLALFEQRYYLAGLLIAVILVIMLFIQ